MRRLGRVLAALGLLVLLASPVRAECDGPYPSFREVLPTAERVIVGEVTAVRPSEWLDGSGRSSRFTLRAWSIRDGAGPIHLDVDDVRSQPCAGDLVARVGDQVAIAFEGRAFNTQVQANAIAWIAGQPPELAGIEVVTVAQVYELLGLPPPAVMPLTELVSTQGRTSAWPAVGAAVAVLLLLSAGLFRLVR